MKILVTGGFGFIGSNFINYISKIFPNIKIYNIDKLSPQSNINNIKSNKVKSFIFDLNNKKKLNSLFEKNNFKYIYHFAAESHVDRSITKPNLFIKSNIIGTYNLLQASITYKVEKFINISTDEVYGSTTKKKFSENSPMRPSSPYSSSKAAACNLVSAWGATYNLNYINLYLSNNYGPLQNKEKLIPKIISNLKNDIKIPIYGSGKNIREWMYVEDSCKLIYTISRKNYDIKDINISSGISLSNLKLLKIIFNIMNIKSKNIKNTSFKNIFKFVDDRPGHDFAYLMKSSKLLDIQKFKFIDIEKGILKTVEYFEKN